MENDNSRDGFQAILEQLKAPIPDLSTLLSLLSTLLGAYNLLPPRYQIHLKSSATPGVSPGSLVNTILKTLPHVQRILLLKVIPTWDVILNGNDASNGSLIDQFFVPDIFSNASTSAGSVALCSYGVLLTNLSVKNGSSSLDHTVRLLERLVKEYPIDRMYQAVFGPATSTKRDGAKRNLEWEDCVKDLCMAPAKVANAVLQTEGGTVPDALENASYFNALSIRVEELVLSLSSSRSQRDCIEPLSYLLQKLVNIGLFPPNPPTSRSQPSFFPLHTPHYPSTP